MAYVTMCTKLLSFFVPHFANDFVPLFCPLLCFSVFVVCLYLYTFIVIIPVPHVSLWNEGNNDCVFVFVFALLVSMLKKFPHLQKCELDNVQWCYTIEFILIDDIKFVSFSKENEEPNKYVTIKHWGYILVVYASGMAVCANVFHVR